MCFPSTATDELEDGTLGRPGPRALPKAQDALGTWVWLTAHPNTIQHSANTSYIRGGMLDSQSFLRLNILKQVVKTIPILEALWLMF